MSRLRETAGRAREAVAGDGAWKALFLAVNLFALGLAAWTVSSSDWGYELDGFALVLAPLLAVSLLCIGLLAGLLYRSRSDDPGEDPTQGDSASHETGSPASKKRGYGEETEFEHDSGHDLPDRSGEQQPATANTDGTGFAAEGFGLNDNQE